MLIFSLAAAYAWLVPVAGVAAIVLQPEIENSFLENNDFMGAAVLEDGSFALAGTTTTELPDGEQGHMRFEVQTYSPQGIPVGPPFVPQPLSLVGTGTVSALGDRYFVSWQIVDWQNFPAKASRATEISKTGDILVKPFRWPNSDIEFYGRYYRYGGSPTWAFLPVVYQADGVDWEGQTVLKPTVQVYGRDAKPVGRAAELVQAGLEIGIHDVAMNAAGRFVVVADKCVLPGGPVPRCARGLQVFDASGRSLTGFLAKGLPPRINRDGTANSLAVAAMDSAGGFLLGWVTGVFTDQKAFVVRLFSAAGEPASSLKTVGRAQSPDSLGLVRPVALGNNRYLLSWSIEHPDHTVTIYLGELDSRVRLSKPLSIKTGILTPDGYHIELNGSRKGILTWTTFEGPGAFTGHLRMFSIRER